MSVRMSDVSRASSAENISPSNDAKPFWWIPDETVEQCMNCCSNFSFFNRRHHCRICGKVLCDSCTPHRQSVEGQSDQRVCTNCFAVKETPRASYKEQVTLSPYDKAFTSLCLSYLSILSPLEIQLFKEGQYYPLPNACSQILSSLDWSKITYMNQADYVINDVYDVLFLLSSSSSSSSIILTKCSEWMSANLNEEKLKLVLPQLSFCLMRLPVDSPSVLSMHAKIMVIASTFPIQIGVPLYWQMHWTCHFHSQSTDNDLLVQLRDCHPLKRYLNQSLSLYSSLSVSSDLSQVLSLVTSDVVLPFGDVVFGLLPSKCSNVGSSVKLEFDSFPADGLLIMSRDDVADNVSISSIDSSRRLLNSSSLNEIDIDTSSVIGSSSESAYRILFHNGDEGRRTILSSVIIQIGQFITSLLPSSSRLDAHFQVYRSSVVGSSCGVIETVPSSVSFAKLRSHASEKKIAPSQGLFYYLRHQASVHHVALSVLQDSLAKSAAIWVVINAVCGLGFGQESVSDCFLVTKWGKIVCVNFDRFLSTSLTLMNKHDKAMKRLREEMKHQIDSLHDISYLESHLFVPEDVVFALGGVISDSFSAFQSSVALIFNCIRRKENFEKLENMILLTHMSINPIYSQSYSIDNVVLKLSNKEMKIGCEMILKHLHAVCMVPYLSINCLFDDKDETVGVTDLATCCEYFNQLTIPNQLFSQKIFSSLLTICHNPVKLDSNPLRAYLALNSLTQESCTDLQSNSRSNFSVLSSARFESVDVGYRKAAPDVAVQSVFSSDKSMKSIERFEEVKVNKPKSVIQPSVEDYQVAASGESGSIWVILSVVAIAALAFGFFYMKPGKNL